MIVERTIEIPASRRINIDLPPQIPTGKAKIAINIINYPETHTEAEAFDNEEEATAFATSLSLRNINEAW